MSGITMRLLLCLLISALFGAVLGFILRSGNTRTETSGVHSFVYFDRTVIEFGNVPQDKVLNGTFNFTNRGSNSITIKRISTSCGCLATYTKKSLILPGETGTIQVQLTTNEIAAPSKLVKLIDVEFEPVMSSVQLMVCADVSADLLANPKQIVFEKKVL